MATLALPAGPLQQLANLWFLTAALVSDVMLIRLFLCLAYIFFIASGSPPSLPCIPLPAAPCLPLHDPHSARRCRRMPSPPKQPPNPSATLCRLLQPPRWVCPSGLLSPPPAF